MERIKKFWKETRTSIFISIAILAILHDCQSDNQKTMYYLDYIKAVEYEKGYNDGYHLVFDKIIESEIQQDTL